jgi:hypothetical protein
MTDQTSATGHTAEALDASTRAERERCLAWVEHTLKENAEVLEMLKIPSNRAEMEYANAHLRQIRQRIESGETP